MNEQASKHTYHIGMMTAGKNGMRFFCTVEAMIAICSRFMVSNRKKSHNPIGVFGVENAPVLFFSQIYTEYL